VNSWTRRLIRVESQPLFLVRLDSLYDPFMMQPLYEFQFIQIVLLQSEYVYWTLYSTRNRKDSCQGSIIKIKPVFLVFSNI
jgi:hypothetical protein